MKKNLIEKINYFKTRLDEFKSEKEKLASVLSNNKKLTKQEYKSLKSINRKLNKVSRKYNNACYYWTKYLLLNQKKILFINNKKNDVSLIKFIEFIEKYRDNEDILKANIFELFHINQSTRRYNKLLFLLKYLKHQNKKRYVLFQKRVKQHLKKHAEYLAMIKKNNLTSYHANLIKKLEKSKRSDSQKDKKSKYVIDLKDVSKYYFNNFIAFKVLNDIYLQIKYGEFVVILGPSGSGKTTLLNIISGMDKASYGQTIICNKNLINFSFNELTKFRKNNIGYVFQQYGLLPNLTVFENVEIGQNLSNIKYKNKEEKENDINNILKLIGLYQYRNNFPHQLSGGQQQRVSIARSIAKRPNIIFGDEPTGAVDEEMSKNIMQLFVDINKKYKTTIIIVTHNPAIANLADKVINVKNGVIDSIKINKHPKKVDQIKWS